MRVVFLVLLAGCVTQTPLEPDLPVIAPSTVDLHVAPGETKHVTWHLTNETKASPSITLGGLRFAPGSGPDVDGLLDRAFAAMAVYPCEDPGAGGVAYVLTNDGHVRDEYPLGGTGHRHGLAQFAVPSMGPGTWCAVLHAEGAEATFGIGDVSPLARDGAPALVHDPKIETRFAMGERWWGYEETVDTVGWAAGAFWYTTGNQTVAHRETDGQLPAFDPACPGRPQPLSVTNAGGYASSAMWASAPCYLASPQSASGFMQAMQGAVQDTDVGARFFVLPV